MQARKLFDFNDRRNAAEEARKKTAEKFQALKARLDDPEVQRKMAEQKAIADARANVAFYTQSPQYLRYFEAIGFGKEAKAIQAAFAQQDFAGMEQACPDEMVSAITVLGSAADVKAQVIERASFADSITPVVPQFGMADDKAATYRQRIADLFF